MSLEQELRVALDAARQAGELAKRYLAAGVTAETKSDESPVTIADRENEKLITGLLLAAFPDDGVLGEEGAGIESRSGRRWIIDPIDGTRDFVRRNRYWAVLIALESEGEPVLGLCYLPMLDEMYHATKGGGAFLNGATIRVSEIATPEQAVVCPSQINNADAYGDPKVWAWLSRFWAARSLGGAPDAMMVASGQAEVWLEPTAKAWDLAPMKVIIEEAGGRFFNYDGGTSVYGGDCICCNPAIEGEVRAFFGIAHMNEG